MNGLNFDCQRLPPFLIGYFVDSKIGEREIIATVMDLVQRGMLFIVREGEYYTLRRVQQGGRNDFENKIISLISEDGQNIQAIMKLLRSNKSVIFKAFGEYLEQYYHKITEKKISLLFISLSVKVTVNEDVSGLRRTFGENKILPKLPEKDKKSLEELVAFLENHPVNPENISAEFMPYSIALGHNSYWMKEFGAESSQRDIVPDLAIPQNLQRPMERKSGFGVIYEKKDSVRPRE